MLIRPRMVQMSREPTPKEIIKLIAEQDRYRARYRKLQNYYEGYNSIIHRSMRDTTKPNNRLVSGYPAYITDLMQGYFIGKPVTYTSANKELIRLIQDINNYNDEQDENSELAKIASIKGRAYEIVYFDEDSQIRFNELDPENVIMVHDDSINPEPLVAIRIISDKRCEVYTRTEVIEYRIDGSRLIQEGRNMHGFSQVPIIEFLNNKEGIGDFERVISLIDAYDRAQSDTANDFEEFTDAFLCLVNLNGTDREDIEQLKRNKVLLLDEQGDAQWLIKNINDAALENYKNRLNDDILRFAKIPDVTDNNFVGNASGVAMKYKLLALDQVIATKQRKFKRALQRRLELICEALSLKRDEPMTDGPGNYDYRDIQINFEVNKPIDEKAMLDTAIAMMGITSTATALSRVPGVDDVEKELEAIRQERGAYAMTLDEVPDE